MVQNKTLILAKRPVGFPIPGEDLVITTPEIDLAAPPPEGGLVLKTNYVSYDPFLRGKMKVIKSYTAGFELQKPLYNAAISTVVASGNARFKKGDVVLGASNFAEYAIIPRERAEKEETAGGFSVLSNPLGLDPAVFLGALGMSGLTAYSSLYAIGKPVKGETIFVSAASGSVGQIVGQLAKREGLVVIGSVGSDEKLKFIQETLGFDGAFNYKTESPAQGLERVLKELGKPGLDIYYDNVGGETLDAAIAAMNERGRIGMPSPSTQSQDRLTGHSGVRQRFSDLTSPG